MTNVTNVMNVKKPIRAYDRIPYSLIKAKTKDEDTGFVDEFTQILHYYDVYNNGVQFMPDGNAGHYVPSNLHFKLVANLINKESRFLFAEPPDIKVDTRSDIIIQGEKNDDVDAVQEFVNKVIEENKLGDQLLKASKDCFIGKRVACVVNFNEETGVKLSMLVFSMTFHTILIHLAKISGSKFGIASINSIAAPKAISFT